MPHYCFLFLDENLLVANGVRHSLSSLACGHLERVAGLVLLDRVATATHSCVEAEGGRFKSNLQHRWEVKFLNVSEENLSVLQCWRIFIPLP